MFAGTIAVLVAGLIISTNVVASDALARLRSYVELDTTNPPGNESAGVDFFRAIFDEAGIASQSAEAAPGRGNIWARIEGGDAPALILLHHIDVVSASVEAWQTPPFAAVEKDGKLYGRGTLDTKGLGIAHLEAFLALHRRGEPLARDVVFLATADEEAGGLLGAGWLRDNHPAIFRGAGYLLNEGGLGVQSSASTVFRIEVAQKRPFWVRLTAHDRPGHASRPYPTAAPARLVSALERITAAPFPLRVIPPVRAMFTGMAERETDAWRASFADIDAAITDPAFVTRLHEQKPGLHALLRNTCAITVLSGSAKTNVVPPTASAELDCRILPDEDAARFRDALIQRIADPAISLETFLTFDAAHSETDTDLFRLLSATSRAHYPEAHVVASVSGGFTDSHFFREAGIASYGYAPFVIPEASLGGVHGNNEHIPIETFHRGVAIMTEIVATFALSATD